MIKQQQQHFDEILNGHYSAAAALINDQTTKYALAANPVHQIIIVFSLFILHKSPLSCVTFYSFSVRANYGTQTRHTYKVNLQLLVL